MKPILLILAIFLVACGNNTKKNVPITNDNNDTPPKAETLASSRYLKGIDIHDSNQEVNWDTLKPQGVSFILIKATGGETYRDSLFTRNWKDAQTIQLTKGAYHFYYFTDDPVVQANFFLSRVQDKYSENDLPPTVDLEQNTGETTISLTQLQNDVKQWLNTVETAMNRTPMIYASTNFANQYLNDTIFSKYPLWLADYQTEPHVPEAWKDKGWVFWQYEGDATFPGISDQVDLDYSSKSLLQLQEMD